MSDALSFVNGYLGTTSYLKAKPSDVQTLRDTFEAALIQWALARTKSCRRAAELLGVNRNTLRKQMADYGIAIPERDEE